MGIEGVSMMAIYYYCRHCQKTIGKLNKWVADLDQLGINELTHEERMEMVDYDSQGNLHVKVICEECENILRDNPDYYENESFLH